MASFDELLKRVDDLGLRDALAREYRRTTSDQRFGLVFDRHLPETVRLPKLALRRGLKAGWRDGRDQSILHVERVRDLVAMLVRVTRLVPGSPEARTGSPTRT
jgi:adenine-specific DNA-methyltransferase